MVLSGSILLLVACANRPTEQPQPQLQAQPSTTQIGSCSLNLPESTPTDVIIQAVLSAEGQFIVEQNIRALMQLWSEDSHITDAKHTPGTPADDQVWQGKDAIRNRYVSWVFPGAPAMAQPSDMAVSINNDVAIVTSTTRIGDEVSPGGDRWVLANIDGCWVIDELVFNLEQ